MNLAVSQELVALTAHLGRLPTLPRHVRELLQLLDRPATPLDRIRAEIEKDVGLAGAVLRLVNSGFYGLGRRINTISQAIVLLGFSAVKNLVLSASAASLMQQGGTGLYEHSLACALATQALSRQLAVGNPEELYAAGLLHDVGKVILAGHFPAESTQIAKLLSESDLTSSEAEFQILSVTHPEIGGWLLHKWELPDEIVEAVALHHQPATATTPWTPAAALIHLADIFIRAEGFVRSGDAVVMPPAPAALAVLNVTLTDIEPLMDHLAAVLQSVPRPGSGG